MNLLIVDIRLVPTNDLKASGMWIPIKIGTVEIDEKTTWNDIHEKFKNQIPPQLRIVEVRAFQPARFIDLALNPEVVLESDNKDIKVMN
jgi:hypothetical protein